MSAYQALTSARVSTRDAASLTGVPRATAARATRPPAAGPTPVSPVVPANRLSEDERERVLAVLNSAEFVDQPPLQVYATLLERGRYLCSVSTMYRILAENNQVKERRRLARHPARAVPELVATGPGRSIPGTSPSWPARPRGSTTTRT
jgi:putative transposase